MQKYLHGGKSPYEAVFNFAETLAAFRWLSSEGDVSRWHIACNLLRDINVKSCIAISKGFRSSSMRVADNRMLRLAPVSHFVWYIVLWHVAATRLSVSFYSFARQSIRSHSTPTCLTNVGWRAARDINAAATRFHGNAFFSWISGWCVDNKTDSLCEFVYRQ